MYVGVPLVIVPDYVIYDPPSLCAFIKKHQITQMLFTPSLIEAVLDTQPQETLDDCFKQFKYCFI